MGKEGICLESGNPMVSPYSGSVVTTNGQLQINCWHEELLGPQLNATLNSRNVGQKMNIIQVMKSDSSQGKDMISYIKKIILFEWKQPNNNNKK